ncbi:histidine kinase dimerization/phosphoacceptor domain -containing protein [Marinimicrococcus flavescens]|uniref:Histidine kinase dimerization/phosphoacceptor domain -containing protein n=1 Tax=Marinimicrococcus flavescens TaxID=3031815 RepID=A0AAP3XRN7_9PROT|nr:histidine kinase dimerization/phosphoacceptor domain -containing protein [Marinimicrococcus flavescens]
MAESLDLSNCDREPIHIPGSIQPHGLLLVLEPLNGCILQLAGDPERILGMQAAEVLGAPIEKVLGAAGAALPASCSLAGQGEPVYAGAVAGPPLPGPLDLSVHERDGVVILELEPSTPGAGNAAQLLGRIRAIGSELEAAAGLDELCRRAAAAMRRLTGFDRVMIYRFLEDGSGCVAAEAGVEGLPTFLNHHFPASDIPRQARALYVRNTIRVIPDTGYTPAPLTPSVSARGATPLDMSDCGLRSVSPIHVQYLKNMGVAASMSVSIVCEGALWGLIACHHGTPRLVPYEQREACKHVGQILAQQVSARDEAENHAQAWQLAAAREQLVAALAAAEVIETALLEQGPELRQLVPADGTAIVLGQRVVRFGHTPGEGEIRALAGWLSDTQTSDPWATDRLSHQFEPASAWRATGSGVLATTVRGTEPLLLLWFRAERIETINWAGNPHKPAAPGELPGQLTPRKSFETWCETVAGRSRPWSAAELAAAGKLRQALLDLRQRQSLRELNASLHCALADKEALLAQKDLLMREVHHRVQNSLQLVSSMLRLQGEEIGDAAARASFEEACRRLLAVSMVHQRLWRSDQIQAVEFGSYLRELRDGLVRAWGPAWADQVAVQVPAILVPTSKAVALALVITELVTNAVKYAYDGKAGSIDVTAKPMGRSMLRVTVADRGAGIADTAANGFGSRLVEALVRQIGGEISARSSCAGTRITLTVPIGTETSGI